MSLVVAELCNFGIAKVVNVDHHKALQFHKRGAELYLQVDKRMQSPVMASGYTDHNVEKMGLVQVCHGLPGGACPKILRHRSFAVSSKLAKEINLKLHATEMKYRLEIWKYAPELIGSNGYADILSVFLSKIETMDGYTYRYKYERMKHSVLENVKWADSEADG